MPPRVPEGGWVGLPPPVRTSRAYHRLVPARNQARGPALPPPPRRKGPAGRFKTLRMSSSGVAAIPPRLWRAYRRDMIVAGTSRGARTVAFERSELRSGRLRVLLLQEVMGQPFGFILHPPKGRVGLQAETIYLDRAHRSRSSLRDVLRGLMEKRRVFSMTGSILGVDPTDFGKISRAEGFRRIERRRLWIDPRRVRRYASSSPGISLRSLYPSDERGVGKLVSRAYAHHIDEAFGPGGRVSKWGPKYVHGLFKPGKHQVDFATSFVAHGPRGLVGDVLVTRANGTTHVQDLSVLPGLRGHGIGTALLRRSLTELAGQGVRRVDIGVTLLNPTKAYSLYTRLGFRRDLKAKRDYGLWVHEGTRRKLHLAILGESPP